jgi:hypothetical protein
VVNGETINLGGDSSWAVIGLHQPVSDNVIPEVPLGTIAISASMIIALFGFAALPKLKKRML